MQHELLSTPRLLLRKVDSTVHQFVFQNLNDDELINFFGFTNAQQLEKEKQRHRYGVVSFNRSFVYFQLIDKITKQTMGWCGFHTWYIEHDRAELGYQLYRDEFKNKGYMTEALSEIMRYGFEQLNLHRIEAMVGKDNVPSLLLLSKNNFVQEGVLKEHYLVNGVYEDSIIFGCVKGKN